MATTGMTFGMAAQDQGAENALGTALQSLNDLNDAIEEQQKISKKGSFITKLKDQIRDFNIASIASKMGDLTGTTNNLTTSLENFGMQAAQSARPILVQAGVTGKALDKMTSKVTGMAYGMEVDAGTIASSFAAVETASSKAKGAIDHLGLSMADLVKLSQATGQSTEDLVKVVGSLSTHWNLSDEQVKTLMNDVAAMGRQAGLGAAAYLGLGESMEVVDQALAASMLPKTPETIMKINKSVTRLAGAYHEGLGIAPKDAMASAQKAFGAFAEEVAKQNEQMMRGSQETWGPLTTAMTELFGFDVAQSMMAKGLEDPMGLITDINARLTDMTKTMPEAMRTTWIGRFKDALAGTDTNLAYLATNTQNGNVALQRMAQLAPAAGNELKKMGQEGFRTTIGLQKQLDMTKEVFENRLASIAKKDVKEFVQEQRVAYKEVGDKLIELGSDKTWGPLVHAWSGFKRGGLTAGLKSLGKQLGMDTKNMGKFAAKVQIGMDFMKDMGDALGPIMTTLGQFGPLGVLAGGIVGFFMLDPIDRKKIWDSLKPIWEKIKKVWTDEIKPVIEKVFKADIFPAIKSGLKSLWKSFTEVDPTTKKSMAQELGEGVLVALKWALDQVVAYIGSDKLALGAAVLLAIKGSGLAGGIASQISGGIGKALGAIGPVAWAATVGVAIGGAIWQYIKSKQEEDQQKANVGYKTNVTRLKNIQAAKGRFEEASTQIGEVGAGNIGALRERGLAPQEFTKYSKFAEYGYGGKEKKFAESAARSLAMQNILRTGGQLEMTAENVSAGMKVTSLHMQSYMEQLEKIPYAQKVMEDAYKQGPEQFGTQVATLIQTLQEMPKGEVDKMIAQGTLMQASIESWKQASTGVSDAQDTWKSSALMGKTFMEDVSKGITEGGAILADTMEFTLEEAILDQTAGKSPIPSGPLKGDTLPNAGEDMLKSILSGIERGQGAFQKGFADVLSGSLVYAMADFRSDIVTQVDQTLKIMDTQLQKVLGADVYKQMVLNVGPAPTEETKKVAEAAFTDTGVNGIKMAILTQTDQITKVLNKIEMNTRMPTTGKGAGKKLEASLQ